MSVLVVDTSAMIRRLVRSELEQAGYEVVEAETQAHALEILVEVPGIQLMTLGVVLDGGDGFSFLQELSSAENQARLAPTRNQRVPSVFVTSSDTEENRLRGFKVGAADFIQKPWPKGELKRTVDRILGSDSALAGLSVLIVDDSPSAREIVSSCLEQLGVNTYMADDGDSGYAILEQMEGAIDLVVTDLKMKNMDGDALCLRIRNDLGAKDLPVIFLSRIDDRETILSLFKMGATDYLTKPFFREELVARLRTHLERQALTRELQKHVMQLEGLNQLKDDFLAVCSHDLRSPLVGMMGFADMLADDDDLSGDHREMLGGIKASGEYLLELINDILDLGRIDATKDDLNAAPVSIHHVLETSLQTLRYIAKPKDTTLYLVDRSAGRRVQGDRNALTRVFNNLISNAIKFSPAGSEVTVTIGPCENDRMPITVVDTGIGIPNEQIPHLFSRYSKASRTGTSGEKGTGLGLVITRELVEAHLGTVVACSEEGKGSTFTVTLPALKYCDDEVADQEILTADIATDEDEPKRVLLVDDDPTNLKVGRHILEKLGHDVTVSEGGQEAVEMYRESLSGDRFQIVLMDMEMPGVDGLEASRRIRAIEEDLPEEHPYGHDPVPILAMTANTIEGHLSACLTAGMNDFLTKPFRVDQIRRALARWSAQTVA